MVTRLLFSLLLSILNANINNQICGTEGSSNEEIRENKILFERWLSENSSRPEEIIHILVVFHVIHRENGEGNISDQTIYDQFDWMNMAFAPHNIVFTVVDIDRTANDEWFEDWYGSDVWPYMEQLAVDPYYYLNAYSADLPETDGGQILGYSYLGNTFGPDDYRQSINLDYNFVGYGFETAGHEVGHHLGLNHTFHNSCSSVNDGIDDTPAMHEDYNYTCDENQDSCPEMDGLDPVRNYMNYSSDACQNNFTQGQEDYMGYIIENYHPGYTEHDIWYPNLYINNFALEDDTDGDQVFNPGESINIKIELGNYVGATANDISLILSTHDERISIVDSTITFFDSLESNSTLFYDQDWFTISSDQNASLGNIPLNVKINSDDEDFPYQNEVLIEVKLSLNQYGFPSNNITIKSSPLIADLNGDLYNEIYFGSDDGKFYGLSKDGQNLDGFPFDAGYDIRSSAALGDFNSDDIEELVFGTSQGMLYVLNHDGTLNMNYYAPGKIWGAPAVSDLDGDSDLEIVFTTENSNNGKLYAIHHNGNLVDGFPADFNEKMMVGPAIGDLEGDGVLDIVVVTWNQNIIAVSSDGNIKNGFPFSSNRRFNSPPTLVDLDNNGTLEIIAGNDNGALHVLNYEGLEIARYDTGDDIRGGISVADIDDDGSLELLFTGYDDLIHIWNPFSNEELEGWPFQLGANSLSGPLTADFDNDGDLEILTAMKNGTVSLLHHDASYFSNFPINIMGIESTPAIDDIDNDGDFDLVFATTQGLQVIDVKNPKGNHGSWRMHRGNQVRTGVYEDVLLSKSNDSIILDKFYVSNNYPNPFNPITHVDILIPSFTNLKVSIFNISGKLINTLIDEKVSLGNYTLSWRGTDFFGNEMSSGLYFFHISTDNKSVVQKITLIK